MRGSRFILMGVAGCGKSSLGRALADRVPLDFVDSDDLHPRANIEKMAAGQPLTDADRWPWLDRVGARLASADGPVAIACSALRRAYRDRIRGIVPGGGVAFLHLAAPQAVIAERIASRTGHFMPPALLQSQYDTLEPLEPDEIGEAIDVSVPLADVVAAAERIVRARLGA